MNRFVIPLILACSIFGGCAVSAQDAKISDSYQTVLEKLFELSNQKSQYEIAMMAGFDASVGPALKTMPPEALMKFERAMGKVKEFMLEEMGWEVVKPEMIELYAKHFTEEEIKPLIPLFSDPNMQNFLSKQLALLPVASKIGADKATGLQGQIQKIVMEEMAKP